MSLIPDFSIPGQLSLPTIGIGGANAPAPAPARVTLTLGDFVFADTEIPEKIPFGGEQALAVHELVGGVRVIDAMGPREKPLEWSGLLLGRQALPRARELNRMRTAGKPVLLTWSELKYWVVVSHFTAEFERFYQIPYHVVCTVIQDDSNQVTAASDTDVDALVRQDMSTANDLSDQVGDSTLSGLMDSVNGAISTVSNFATAAQSTINGVLAPIASVQARVGTLIASVGNTVQNVTTLGGVLPNNPIAKQASKLTGQVTAMTQLPTLVNLRNVMGRVGANLGAINSGNATVTTAGGNLYTTAAKAYGDATAWTTLAKANNTTDPQVQGVKQIQVPARADDSGGVLYA